MIFRISHVFLAMIACGGMWAAEVPALLGADGGAATILKDAHTSAEPSGDPGASLASPANRAAADERPSTGTPLPAYAPLDQAINAFMDRIGAQAATVAVYADGKMAYSRGFGWRDEARKQPVQPDDLMRIASVSKPITASLVKKLMTMDDLKLSPETKAFSYIAIPPRPGAEVDARLSQVTVQHLLEHKGGWDSTAAGDPMFKLPQIKAELKLHRPPAPAEVVQYMLGQPLQFEPGVKSVYSNFGYCVLGRVVEKATGATFDNSLQRVLCEPLKISGQLKLGRSKSAQRDPREVWYPLADDAFSLEVLDSVGGMIASAPALGRFMQAYWLTGEPRRSGERGQHWIFFGSLPGTTAMVIQRPDGIDVAVLLNARRDDQIAADNDALKTAVMSALDSTSGVGRRP